jgi:hypothetical protein
MDREDRLAESFIALADTFVALADTLADDFDMVGVLGRLSVKCAELTEASVVAVMLSEPGSELRSVAVSHRDDALTDLLKMGCEAGPAFDCFHTGERVGPTALSTEESQWPVFTDRARQEGYRTVCALPMRLRRSIIGSLLLLRTDPTPLAETDIRLAQALADAATIGIVHQQVLHQHIAVSAQLRTALESRIAIEQAKGVLASRWGITPDEAFESLRHHARSRHLLLKDVAHDVVHAGLQLDRA